MKEIIVQAFEESVRVKQAFLRDNIDALVFYAIVAAFRNGNKLLLFGNGGSAADAQHIAAEFVNRFRIERPPLPAIALTTDSSALTSIANDYDYAEIFAKQVRALGKAGDIAIAISTSGNAANVLSAVEASRAPLRSPLSVSPVAAAANSPATWTISYGSRRAKTVRIQETHILIAHVICELVDMQLFPTS